MPSLELARGLLRQSDGYCPYTEAEKASKDKDTEEADKTTGKDALEREGGSALTKTPGGGRRRGYGGHRNDQ